MSFTYPDVGGTSEPALPRGYNHLRYRTRLRTTDLRAAAEAILTFRMHRATGARIVAAAERAAPGVDVMVGLGLGRFRFTAPCQVIWTADEPDRGGFAYGTLAGHPESGEESFLVERGPDGALWFTVTAFSRPVRWYTKAAGPLVPVAQRLYARSLGWALDRVCRRGTSGTGAPE